MKFNYFLNPTDSFISASFEKNPLLNLLLYRLNGKRIFITGGTGFFGRWLLALLHKVNQQGAQCHVTILSRQPESFLMLNPYYRHVSWLSWWQGDLRDMAHLTIEPFDYILHAATDTSATSQTDPLQLFDVISTGARNIYQFAAQAGAQRVLVTGSGAQYGELNALHVDEGYTGACNSTLTSSAYGEAKRIQELFGAIYAEKYSFDLIMTRCFAFAGPGLPLDGHFAIGNFIRDAVLGKPIVLQSDGTAVRSYLHGADLAIWLLFLLLYGKAGEAYNVGSDQAISIVELANKVNKYSSIGCPIEVRGQASDSRSLYVPDIQKARSLGLDTWHTIEQSIADMILWFTVVNNK